MSAGNYNLHEHVPQQVTLTGSTKQPVGKQPNSCPGKTTFIHLLYHRVIPRTSTQNQTSLHILCVYFFICNIFCHQWCVFILHCVCNYIVFLYLLHLLFHFR